MQLERGLFYSPDTPPGYQFPPPSKTQDIEIPPFDFSSTTLSRRNTGERFNDPKEIEHLVSCMKEAWTTLHRDPGYESSTIISQTNNGTDNFKWGEYLDGEPFAVATKKGREELLQKPPSHLHIAINLENPGDVLATETILDTLHNPNTIIATGFFPLERGDRTELRSDGTQELLVVRRLIKNMFTAGVRGLIHVTPHSPAFPWMLLKEGIAPLSLSNIPDMIREATYQGFLDRPFIVASGDDGAYSSGAYVKKQTDCAVHISGKKEKKDGKTIVTFSEEDLAHVNGKTVLFVEDIISSGKTMFSGLRELLNRGHAERIVILVTYPIFAGDALQHLGFDPRIQIVTTNGKEAEAKISTSNNIIVMSLLEKLPHVLDLDRNGVDFWSKEGAAALKELGLCLFPW